MPNQFDDDARLFGQDLIDATRRWNAPVVAQRVPALENDLRSTQTQLARRRHRRSTATRDSRGRGGKRTSSRVHGVIRADRFVIR